MPVSNLDNESPCNCVWQASNETYFRAAWLGPFEIWPARTFATQPTPSDVPNRLYGVVVNQEGDAI